MDGRGEALGVRLYVQSKVVLGGEECLGSVRLCVHGSWPCSSHSQSTANAANGWLGAPD
jgi:hypothetical protein